MICHPIEPVFDNNSKILILGSFPSVKSRETAFYYGHPQNRFWKVLAAVLGAEVPETVEQKRKLLLSHGIALWDVIAMCEVTGSADNSIANVVPNDLTPILSVGQIRRIFLNGKTAKRYYDRFLCRPGMPEAICLPSTSPANAAWSIDRLTQAWQMIHLN